MKNSLFILFVLVAINKTFADNYFVQLKQNDRVYAEDNNATELQNLNGAIFNLNAQQLKQLQKNKNVLYIEKEIFHPLPLLPNETKNFSQEVLSKYEPQISWGIKLFNFTSIWHKTTGKGVKVLFLDSGVDKDHPLLKNNFLKGMDFVKDQNTPYDYFDKSGHGTHTAGTAVGTKNSFGFSGVAPEAKFLMARVCGEKGCSSTAMLQALDWALAENPDVINISIAAKWLTPAEIEAIKKVLANNIPIVAASGNSGVDHLAYPAVIEKVISVGAIDQVKNIARFSQWGAGLSVVAPGVDIESTFPLGAGRIHKLQMMPTQQIFSAETMAAAQFPVQNITAEIIFAGHGSEAEFSRSNVSDKFAVVERGQETFHVLAKNCMLAHCKGLFIYNTSEDSFSGGVGGSTKITIPVFAVTFSTGQQLKVPGMSLNLQTEASDYTTLSGTSMAAPFVTGVVALKKSLNKNISVEELKNQIENSASALPDPTKSGHGLINPEGFLGL